MQSIIRETSSKKRTKRSWPGLQDQMDKVELQEFWLQTDQSIQSIRLSLYSKDRERSNLNHLKQYLTSIATNITPSSIKSLPVFPLKQLFRRESPPTWSPHLSMVPRVPQILRWGCRGVLSIPGGGIWHHRIGWLIERFRWVRLTANKLLPTRK